MKYINLLPLIILFTILNSCIKTLDLEAKNKTSKLVVNSLFNPKTNWVVGVSKSLSVLDRGELSAVTNAVVKIYDENDIFIEQLSYTSSGQYLSFNHPIIGKLYKIKVSAPGFETVTSENYCPQKPIITSISGVDKKGVEGVNIRSVKLIIQDKANEKNYYSFEMNYMEYSIDTNLSTGGYDTIYITSNIGVLGSNHPYVDEIENNLYNSPLTLNDKLFDGKSQEITFFSYLYNINHLDNYYVNNVSVIALSEESYNYIKSYNAYLITEDNPFAEPVQVFSNIKNGFGIFGGKSHQNVVFTTN